MGPSGLGMGESGGVWIVQYSWVRTIIGFAISRSYVALIVLLKTMKSKDFRGAEKLLCL